MKGNHVQAANLATLIMLCASVQLLGFAGVARADDVKVPAAKANPRYVIKGATVIDKKSGRIWARCSMGQNWKGNKLGCVGIVRSFTYDDAQPLATNGWRIPTADELASLVDYDKKARGQKPVIDEVAFPDLNQQKLVYWTSTPSSGADAYFVDYNDGTLDTDSRKSTYSVRLVRGQQ